MSHICSFLQSPTYDCDDRVLVLNKSTPCSFRQFKNRVLSLAASLDHSLSLTPDSRVALRAASSVEYLQVLLACLWNGWVVVLLNDRWSPQDTTSALQLTTPSVLLTDQSISPTPGVRVLEFSDLDVLDEMRQGTKCMKKAVSDVAVICFTSGTTSSAKGVMISHSAMLFQCFYKTRICEYAKSDVYLHTAPLFHVGGLLSALAMLQIGAQHVFIGNFNAKTVMETIGSYGVTAMIAVPAMLNDLHTDRFPSIRTILIGGGSINSIQRDVLRCCFTEARVYTAYGMSECCSSLVYNGPFLAREFPPLPLAAGCPIPGTDVTIHPTTGEVWTRGPHLMKGYWMDPLSTKRSFSGDWFKTGDIGYLDSHGALWLNGRLKDMIKSGGENIHPVEIENVLIQHPAIFQVVVVGVPHDRLGEAVCVHFVLHKDYHWSTSTSPNQPNHISAEILSTFCVNKGLSKFKVPRMYCPHDTPFEVTATGKVLARHLIGQSSRLRSKSRFTMPTSRQESSYDVESAATELPVSESASNSEKQPSLNGTVLNKRLMSSFRFSAETEAGFCYCIASAGMILTNKYLLTAFDLEAPNCLLLIQFLLTLILVLFFEKLKLLKREPLEWKVVSLWWPVNLIFVGMIGSSFYALQTLQVPMLTLLKNLTNLLTICGDMYFFGSRFSIGVWSSLGLMTLSAFVGSVTDLSFNSIGYSWQIVNCAFTAGYALYLKGVLNRVSEITAKSGGLSDISKVFYNNLLGLPWLVLLILYSNELEQVWSSTALRDPAFVLAILISGVVAFSVSFFSIKFLTHTTSTTYAMVGSLNKIPTAVLGWILFRVPTTFINVASVLVGLCAGVVFVKAKQARKA
eukprot:g8093.t1